MVRIRISLRLMAGAAALALVAHAPVPAVAQDAGSNPQQNGQQQNGQPKQEVKIPAAVLSGLLTGTPEALLSLKQYLAAGTSSGDVSNRAVDVMRQLRNSGLVKDPALVLAAAERVTKAVDDTVNSAKIVKLKVDRNFVPRAGSLAFDFAPADAQSPPGFKKVLPGNPMLKGKDLQGIRGPGDDSVLGGGVAGVQDISVDVPDGEYRVTLMTELLGDEALSLSPFGQQIIANGNAHNVAQATPQDWLNQAVLSNKGMQGMKDASNREGGAITIRVKVTGGKLNLGFNTGSLGQSLRTYLTGMLVEPADEPPSVAAPPEIELLLSKPTDAGKTESQVASSIASLIEESTQPAAGNNNNQQGDLAKPVQTVQQASPS